MRTDVTVAEKAICKRLQFVQTTPSSIWERFYTGDNNSAPGRIAVDNKIRPPLEAFKQVIDDDILCIALQ